MSVINVALSCSRFVAFSHKKLPDVLYERQLVTRNVSGVAIAYIYECICKKPVLSTFNAECTIKLWTELEIILPSRSVPECKLDL